LFLISDQMAAVVSDARNSSIIGIEFPADILTVIEPGSTELLARSITGAGEEEAGYC